MQISRLTFALRIDRLALAEGLPRSGRLALAAHACLSARYGESGLSRNHFNHTGIRFGRLTRTMGRGPVTLEGPVSAVSRVRAPKTYVSFRSDGDWLNGHLTLMRKRHHGAYSALATGDGIRYIGELARSGWYSDDEAGTRKVTNGMLRILVQLYALMP